ncbi:MAG: CYTH domain-containing protein [Desulfuromonas sp.]|nr:CYTH domain-containing protein [Desulfuromonas sp.]
MAIEIERKFLLANDNWRHHALNRSYYKQGYLSTVAQRTVRVRIADKSAWLTVKGKNSGAVRSEFEYTIPRTDAEQMLAQLCEQPLIEKWRHQIHHHGHLWEIDEFCGVNTGLIVAEIELKHQDEQFDRPDWLGAEVTDDPRYFNANLLALPFAQRDTE